MRIVDQSGCIDFLYDNILLVREENIIIAEAGDSRYRMAVYSSEEKAIKAMGRLHYRYSHMDISVWQFPKDSDV